MNKKTSINKQWIIIIVVVVVGALAYFYYTGTASVSSNLLQSTPNSDDQIVGSQELALLNQIKSLRIDTSLFEGAAYKSLQDYTVVIPEQGVGRENPFAPLPHEAKTVPPSGTKAPVKR